jgi:hypothetical protein
VDAAALEEVLDEELLPHAAIRQLVRSRAQTSGARRPGLSMSFKVVPFWF